MHVECGHLPYVCGAKSSYPHGSVPATTSQHAHGPTDTDAPTPSLSSLGNDATPSRHLTARALARLAQYTTVCTPLLTHSLTLLNRNVTPPHPLIHVHDEILSVVTRLPVLSKVHASSPRKRMSKRRKIMAIEDGIEWKSAKLKL